MFGGNTYSIRLAASGDELALRRLADADAKDRLPAGPVLLGELDGRPAAAISLVDGRGVADPSLPTAQLLAHVRIRAGALAAYERTPSLADRIRAALAGHVRPPAAAAAA